MSVFVCVRFACYVYLCIKKGALSESRARQMRRNNNSQTDIKFNTIAIYDCTSSTTRHRVSSIFIAGSMHRLSMMMQMEG